MEDYKMGKRLTQEEVIKQFKEKHGNKYEYDKVIYTGHSKKVIIYCKKCGEYFEQLPYSHKNGQGCPYCSGKKISDKNMLSKLRPELVEYFLTKEEANMYTVNSNKKVTLECPKCNSRKEMQIYNLTHQGFSCKDCSDGISIPEKFCISLLNQLEIKFEKEKIFSWSENKRYDFYIPSLNMIVETHGAQHYIGSLEKYGRRSLVDEQNNDTLKEKNAKENKIEKYIIVNCEKSEFKHLKENFILSFKEIFDFSNIDWNRVWQECQNNLLIEVCRYWNIKKDNDTTLTVAEHFNLSRNTITRYLKKGNELGECIYNPEEEKKKSSRKNTKKVVQFAMNGILIKEYSSMKEASEETGISVTSISACCHEKLKSAGKFKWSFNNHLKN